MVACVPYFVFSYVFLMTQKEAMAVPITEQKLLFDHIREAEKVLHLLETVAPSVLLEQYYYPSSRD